MSEDVLSRKLKLATKVKWALGLVGAVVISPVVFMAVQGIAGLGIALILGLAFVNFTPVIAMKFANWKVKAIVHEAKVNPVETMVNQARDQEIRLEKSKESITTFSTQVKSFEDKVARFRTQYPDEANKFESQLDKMKKLLLYRVEKYKQAKKQYNDFLGTIDKARALWEMSQEAQKMNQLAGIQDDFIEKLKTEVSLESVTKSVNQAFAELETSLMDDESHLPSDYKPSIEYKPVENFIEEVDVVPESIPLKARRRV